jgi:hypothetical protein
MELTLESAFSTGGLVGHLSYFLLALSMMMRVMWMLRVLVIAGSAVGFVFDLYWLANPVGVFWDSMLIVVNLVQLTIMYLQNRRLRFSDEEQGFVDANFPGLSKTWKRRLLDLGAWRDAVPGETLTEQGSPVSHLYYLLHGEVEITSNGRRLGACRHGDFIGEMTALTGAPASGTATVVAPTRCWSVPAADLRELVERRQEVEQSLHSCFRRNLLEKLVEANKLIETSQEMLATRV